MPNLILVDVGFYDYDKTQLHRMNVITGDYLNPIYIHGTFEEQVIKLIYIMLVDTPEKIIFDKNGTGISFYNIFINIIKQEPFRRYFEVDAFGSVTYH